MCRLLQTLLTLPTGGINAVVFGTSASSTPPPAPPPHHHQGSHRESLEAGEDRVPPAEIRDRQEQISEEGEAFNANLLNYVFVLPGLQYKLRLGPVSGRTRTSGFVPWGESETIPLSEGSEALMRFRSPESLQLLAALEPSGESGQGCRMTETESPMLPNAVTHSEY